MAFFRDNTTKTFFNQEWNAAIKVKLFDQERAEFPQAQEYMMTIAKWRTELKDIAIQLKQLYKHRDEMKMREFELQRMITRHENNNNNNNDGDVKMEIDGKNEGSPEENTKRSVWHRSGYNCPVQECRGIIIRNKCGVCETVCCPHCRVVLGQGGSVASFIGGSHVCNPDTVKTIAAIVEESKPCPKCNVPIYKSEGCYQMWCTQCHTAFDWTNGRVITSRIHNPHLMEYLQQRGRGDLLEPCQNNLQFPPTREINQILRNSLTSPVQLGLTNRLYLITTNVLQLYRIVFELRHEVTPAENLRKSNGLRARYLTSEISKEQFLSVVRSRHKTKEKAAELLPLYETVINVVNDLSARLFAQLPEARDHPPQLTALIEAFFVEIDQFIKITNNAIEKFASQWSCKAKTIDNNLYVNW
jgi:hypothetical protein